MSAAATGGSAIWSIRLDYDFRAEPMPATFISQSR